MTTEQALEAMKTKQIMKNRGISAYVSDELISECINALEFKIVVLKFIDDIEATKEVLTSNGLAVLNTLKRVIEDIPRYAKMGKYESDF